MTTRLIEPAREASELGTGLELVTAGWWLATWVALNMLNWWLTGEVGVAVWMPLVMVGFHLGRVTSRLEATP